MGGIDFRHKVVNVRGTKTCQADGRIPLHHVLQTMLQMVTGADPHPDFLEVLLDSARTMNNYADSRCVARAPANSRFHSAPTAVRARAPAESRPTQGDRGLLMPPVLSPSRAIRCTSPRACGPTSGAC